MFLLEKSLQKVDFDENTQFKRCSMAPSSTILGSLIPFDFEERSVYASYKQCTVVTSLKMKGTQSFLLVPKRI